MPTANRTGSISLRTLPQPMRKESNVSKGCLASTDRSPAFLAERFRDRSRTSHFTKNPSGSKRPKAKRAAGDIRNTPYRYSSWKATSKTTDKNTDRHRVVQGKRVAIRVEQE